MAIIPQDMAFSQAREELIATINYCLREPLNIKLYEMEIILRDIYQEVQAAAKQEYDKNLKSYNIAVQAEQEQAKKPKIEEIQEEKSEN